MFLKASGLRSVKPYTSHPSGTDGLGPVVDSKSPLTIRFAFACGVIAISTRQKNSPCKMRHRFISFTSFAKESRSFKLRPGKASGYCGYVKYLRGGRDGRVQAAFDCEHVFDATWIAARGRSATQRSTRLRAAGLTSPMLTSMAVEGSGTRFQPWATGSKPVPEKSVKAS